jgi:NAD(P)-dependent dehydrogenase (short-subunit alcohol dehydrogenase family)
VTAGRLSGRVAVVTGAGQGLGKAIAQVLSGEGAVVALLGRTVATLLETRHAIEDDGGRGLVAQCDVAVRAEVDAAVATVLRELGRIDVLINNAQGGNTNVYAATAGVADDMVLETFRTGPLGTLHMMQACFEPLRDSGHGSVVNFGSGIGVRGAPGMAPYAMAKEAIGALTKVTAIEWGKHQIRVNLVCPAGWSPAAEKYRDENPTRWEQLQKNTPLRRLGDPYDDIGRAVLSLVTDDLKYLTGATLMLDGGQVLLR